MTSTGIASLVCVSCQTACNYCAAVVYSEGFVRLIKKGFVRQRENMISVVSMRRLYLRVQRRICGNTTCGGISSTVDSAEDIRFTTMAVVRTSVRTCSFFGQDIRFTTMTVPVVPYVHARMCAC
jgi:hypothetical protein